jgi:hypothetical protein
MEETKVEANMYVGEKREGLGLPRFIKLYLAWELRPSFESDSPAC